MVTDIRTEKLNHHVNPSSILATTPSSGTLITLIIARCTRLKNLPLFPGGNAKSLNVASSERGWGVDLLAGITRLYPTAKDPASERNVARCSLCVSLSAFQGKETSMRSILGLVVTVVVIVIVLRVMGVL